MKQTELLNYLINALRKAGVLRYKKDFLNYIDIELEIVSAKQLHGFLRRKGEIQNKTFLRAIENKFHFHYNIWNICESSQIKFVKKAIKKSLELQELPNKNALNISDMIHSKVSITDYQTKALDIFAKLHNKAEKENKIDNFLKEGLLEKSTENQEFLVELLSLVYKDGFYAIIVEFILPSLYRPYLLLAEVQKIEAHTLGSLGKYNDAISILEELIFNNTIENINLRTAALSNYKRKLFSSISKPIEQEKLYLLIQGYQTLHAIEGIYSYYTGINLLYMLTLGQILSPQKLHFENINKEEIYIQSKASLKEDKTHDSYYVRMSEFEFKLLLAHEGVGEKIESFLYHETPHISLVERTLRQMKLFVRHCHNDSHPIVISYKNVIEVIQDYIKQAR